jgi:cephalosporin hydroxylase
MITIDRDNGTITADGTTLPLASAEAFRILTDAWIDAGFRVKQSYNLTWLGRPIIQLADDLIRLQEIVYRVQPDVIVETGVAHGGSVIFHASLCKLLERGRVIGVDIDIRAHNRVAIEAHSLFPLITLFEGSSIDPAVVDAVKGTIAPSERVLVVLDSNHTKAHVRAELDTYAPLVAPGSYIVAMDGHVMESATASPTAGRDWATNNPNAAVREFANEHPEFIVETSSFLFNESLLTEATTGFYGGVLKRIQ